MNILPCMIHTPSPQLHLTTNSGKRLCKKSVMLDAAGNPTSEPVFADQPE